MYHVIAHLATNDHIIPSCEKKDLIMKKDLEVYGLCLYTLSYMNYNIVYK